VCRLYIQYTLDLWGKEPVTSYPILTKLCKWAGMANVITDIKFGDGCFSGVDAAWMVNLPFPIDFRMALTTGLCYRVACDTKATM